MRKVCDSSSTFATSRLSARADSRSRPKGFSMMTRVNERSWGPRVSPASFRRWRMVGNSVEGVEPRGEPRVKCSVLERAAHVVEVAAETLPDFGVQIPVAAELLDAVL